MCMGQINQHAEAIHLANYLLAEISQAVVRRVHSTAVGPGRVAIVSESHDSYPLVEEHSECSQGAVDGMAALDCDEGSDFPYTSH